MYDKEAITDIKLMYKRAFGEEIKSIILTNPEKNSLAIIIDNLFMPERTHIGEYLRIGRFTDTISSIYDINITLIPSEMMDAVAEEAVEDPQTLKKPYLLEKMLAKGIRIEGYVFEQEPNYEDAWPIDGLAFAYNKEFDGYNLHQIALRFKEDNERWRPIF